MSNKCKETSSTTLAPTKGYIGEQGRGTARINCAQPQAAQVVPKIPSAWWGKQIMPTEPHCSLLPPGSKSTPWFESPPIPNSTSSMYWVDIHAHKTQNPCSTTSHTCSRTAENFANSLQPFLFKDQESIAIRHLMHEPTAFYEQIPSKSSWMLLFACISLSAPRYYFCSMTGTATPTANRCCRNRGKPWKYDFIQHINKTPHIYHPKTAQSHCIISLGWVSP